MLDDVNKWILIHKAIHSDKKNHLKIDKSILSINKNHNGCRYLKYNNKTFIEQNSTKTSRYATLAKYGHKITWVIKEGRWGLIINDKITKT